MTTTTMLPEPFGATREGEPVHRWTLERGGTRVRLLTYGGILQSVDVPDAAGTPANVVLGLPSVAAYEAAPGPYLGALIGRYANRIAGGSFPLDGRTYTLPRNDGPNCLHGGVRGFDRRVWTAEPVEHGVRLTLTSEDGEEGFPGRLEVAVTHTLGEDGSLRLSYEATTDAPTPVNLTNHSYWNLAGSGPAVGTHLLRIAADRYTPVDGTLIPTGDLAPVTGTRFDFRETRVIGAGYDHNYVLDARAGDGDGAPAAELYAPVSGRVLTIRTTEPGLQLYTGDGLDVGPHSPGTGIALETQAFPDSPNRPLFPDTVLRPGEVHTSVTTYAFATRA